MLDRIRQLCKEKEISIADLESQVGFGAGRIGHWKSSMPKADSLFAVAQALGVSVEYLLTGKNKEPVLMYEDGLKEFIQIYEMLDASRRPKLLELARLYLDDQRKSEEKE